jgi:hypothetical protein
MRMTRLNLVAVLAVAGLLLPPMEPVAAQPQCLLCEETEIWDEEDQEWVTWHWFYLDTGEQCAINPGEWCRACGYQSLCHGPEQPMEGECHEECVSSLAPLAEAVDRLINNPDDQLNDANAEFLVQKIGAEAQLRYDLTTNSVELLDCQGLVARRWALSYSDGPRFASLIE